MRIPHEQLRLDNGLEVIFHPDDRLPRVAVNVLYQVGSRDDPAGLRGVAHLFEHLMFMGTERVPEQQIDLLMEGAGGWNNAYTTHDLTVYYDVGPARLLETLLWIEADRMATLALALTPDKLELQRDVVLNELRQEFENAPYGAAHLRMPGLLFPADHPYSWPIIGRAEDLRAASVPDLQALFARSYSPRNAAVVVAGRFDPAEARRLVRRYFEWIPAEAPGPRPAAPAAGLAGERRETLHDRVELPRLYLVWHSPALYQPGDAEMDLAADILSDGRQSRLHRALVHEQRLALEVAAYQESRELGSLFTVEVTGREGVAPEALEQAAGEVLQELRDQPPSERELQRAQAGFETEFIFKLGRVRRRAELLNLYRARTGQPDFLERDLQRYREVTAESLHHRVSQVLDPQRRLVLTVLPGAAGEAPAGGEA